MIGADVLHSALRAQVFGPREDYGRHVGHVVAFYRVPHEFGLDHWQLAYNKPDRHAGLQLIPREGDVTIAIFALSASKARLSITVTSRLPSGCCASGWPGMS